VRSGLYKTYEHNSVHKGSTLPQPDKREAIKSRERRPALHGDASWTVFTKKDDLDKLFLPFLSQQATSAPECADRLSFFYIFDSL